MHTILFNCIKDRVAYIKTYKTKKACFILLYNFCVMQFLVQTVLDVHSEIHIGVQWYVNYSSTWTKTETLTNFSTFPNKKICENLYRALSSYMQTYRQRSIVKLRDILLQLFIRNLTKKNIGTFLEMLPGIIFSGGTTGVYAKPP